MLKNTGTEPAYVQYAMSLEFDKYNLHDAVRVMWGESYKSNPVADIDIYASLSNNPRLASTAINAQRTEEEGYLEYVAYPVGSDKSDFSLARYETRLWQTRKTKPKQWKRAILPRLRLLPTNTFSSAIQNLPWVT